MWKLLWHEWQFFSDILDIFGNTPSLENEKLMKVNKSVTQQSFFIFENIDKLVEMYF